MMLRGLAFLLFLAPFVNGAYDFEYDDGRSINDIVKEMEEKSIQNIKEYKNQLSRGKSKEEALNAVSVDNLPRICYLPDFVRPGEENPCKSQINNKFRTLDGTCNQINEWTTHGSIYDATGRHELVKRGDGFYYGDEVTDIPTNLPNPRLVSSTLFKDVQREQEDFTNMITAFGQFMVHDLSYTPFLNEPCCSREVEDKDYCARIEVYENDPFYGSRGVKCLNFKRSVPSCFPGDRRHRNPMNVATVWVDLSHVYGTRKYRANQIREFKGGRLRVSKDGSNFLPTVEEIERDTGTKVHFLNDATGIYVAGDDRVNLTPDLTALHIVFLREHNRIAGQISTFQPTWNDEKIYQETRRIMIAQWQKIFTDYGSALLHKGPDYFDGNHTDYVASTFVGKYDELFTGAFRFGHSLIQGNVDANIRAYRLKDNFNNPEQVKRSLADIFTGLLHQKPQQVDDCFTEDITNFLSKKPENDFGEDLIARNIQRGRDHGLVPFYKMRHFSSRDWPSNWDTLPSEYPKEIWDKLQKLYKSPLDVDYYVGGITEDKLGRTMFGKQFYFALDNLFTKAIRADRYFYTHRNQPVPFTQAQLNTIHGRTLGGIICDNTDSNWTLENVFRPASSSNKWIRCHETNKLDISIFVR